MSIELASILVLGAIFLIATVFPIHLGALAISAAFIVGMFVLPGTSAARVDSIVGGFPSDLFIVLTGVTFLFAIARNLALDQLRRHAVSRTDSLVEADLSNVLDDHASIPETVAREQERALLTEAIQSLPERCRQVMTLRVVYGLTQRIIGEKLDISDRTVAAQLAIGTKKCTDFMLRRLADRRPTR